MAGYRCPGGKTTFQLLLLTVLALSLLWPGDHFWGKPGPWQIVFWNYPEQIETIRTALQANQYQEPAAHGVRGSLPVVYHPFHVWIYQLLLFLTPELTTIVFVKQLITLSVCLAGVYYLSRALVFPFYPVLLVLFSPFCYVYSRQLSDDPWLIPLSLLAYCSYASFSRKKRWLPAVSGLLVLLLMFFAHPRGLLPALGFLFMFVLFEYQWVKKHAWTVAVFLVGALIVMLPTLADLYGQLQAPAGSASQSLVPSTQQLSGPAAPGSTFSRLHMLFPLISGGLFFSYDYMQLLSNSDIISAWLHPSITQLLVVISTAGYVFVACGLLLTVARLIQKTGSRRPYTLEDRLGAISLLMVALYLIQVIIFLLVKKFYPPDYHTGVWFAYFYFIWRAIRAFHRAGRLQAVVHVYVAAMAVLWLNMILTIHVSSDYNLGEAVRLAKQVANYSPQSDVVLFVDFTNEIRDALDALENNSDRSMMGFYYQPYIQETKGFIDKMRRHRSNLLGYALNPLVIHYRQRQKTHGPVSRPLVIRWGRDKGRKRLTLVDDPETVRRELTRAGIGGMAPCSKNESMMTAPENR